MKFPSFLPLVLAQQAIKPIQCLHCQISNAIIQVEIARSAWGLDYLETTRRGALYLKRAMYRLSNSCLQRTQLNTGLSRYKLFVWAVRKLPHIAYFRMCGQRRHSFGMTRRQTARPHVKRPTCETLSIEMEKGAVALAPIADMSSLPPPPLN